MPLVSLRLFLCPLPRWRNALFEQRQESVKPRFPFACLKNLNGRNGSHLCSTRSIPLTRQDGRASRKSGQSITLWQPTRSRSDELWFDFYPRKRKLMVYWPSCCTLKRDGQHASQARE